MEEKESKKGAGSSYQSLFGGPTCQLKKFILNTKTKNTLQKYVRQQTKKEDGGGREHEGGEELKEGPLGAARCESVDIFSIFSTPTLPS